MAVMETTVAHPLKAKAGSHNRQVDFLFTCGKGGKEDVGIYIDGGVAVQAFRHHFDGDEKALSTLVEEGMAGFLAAASRAFEAAVVRGISFRQAADEAARAALEAKDHAKPVPAAQRWWQWWPFHQELPAVTVKEWRADEVGLQLLVSAEVHCPCKDAQPPFECEKRLGCDITGTAESYTIREPYADANDKGPGIRAHMILIVLLNCDVLAADRPSASSEKKETWGEYLAKLFTGQKPPDEEDSPGVVHLVPPPGLTKAERSSCPAAAASAPRR
ncbi:unnamed protein product [Symbiodinium natans]|uniref:Uncharacterized protein n=1 Tax=Symbiodinium natans TaxID=878477 RepID=A0A812UPZ7_9DINO|nr:unnamed protein product [Symbiodinium natans]